MKIFPAHGIDAIFDTGKIIEKFPVQLWFFDVDGEFVGGWLPKIGIIETSERGFVGYRPHEPAPCVVNTVD